MKTISYELANKLNKLGVRVKSYMVYLSGIHQEPELLPCEVAPNFHDAEVVAAYTLDEILEMLPAELPRAEAMGELLAWCINEGFIKAGEL